MIPRSVLLTLLFVSLPTWTQTPSESDQFSSQRVALSKTLEQPLRTQLLKKGYTPRNAAIAADNLLNKYARCLADVPRTHLGSDPEVIFFQLGEAKVSAYKSPCLAGFLSDVDGIP